ncbi:MAG: hypothetical protein JWO69_301 [Thermoleophilia bacterium]|nr:hypothetical protein [Thermoleophilia bacterium]
MIIESLVRVRVADLAAEAGEMVTARARSAEAQARRVDALVRDLELPGISTPRQLADAWAGTYGTQGLTIDGAESRVKLSGDTRVVVDAVVRTPAGARAGDTQISMWRDDARELRASYDWMKLEPELRRTGFARDFMARGHERLAEMGVRTLSLTASLRDGGVVWARMPGVRFADPNPAGPVADIVTTAVIGLRINPREGWKLLRAKPQTPGEILAHGDVGARALRGSRWEGEVDFADLLGRRD